MCTISAVAELLVLDLLKFSSSCAEVLRDDDWQLAKSLLDLLCMMGDPFNNQK